ncbi:MAG: SMP-30/gluconolactonase/LRE family protein, partial [Planctomycetia bacterium]|nr:SMP-30/gluconolactonase/LRE family protein [Planctomycetia bacterium]
MTHLSVNTHPTRRRFLQQGALATAAIVAIVASAALPNEPSMAADYSGLKTDDYLGPVEILAKVEDETVFTEGPAAAPDGTLLFTNVPVNKILKWDPHARQLSVFRENSNETNGLYFAPDGSLLACEGAAARITRTDAKTGQIEVLAERYQGRRLAKPNDLCMDNRGRIYFSSRSAVEDPEGENVKAVYRIDTDGSLHQILAWPEVHMPNGIVTSPDNKKLYLIEAHPAADHHRDIRVYDLNADGSVS